MKQDDRFVRSRFERENEEARPRDIPWVHYFADTVLIDDRDFTEEDPTEWGKLGYPNPTQCHCEAHSLSNNKYMERTLKHLQPNPEKGRFMEF